MNKLGALTLMSGLAITSAGGIALAGSDGGGMSDQGAAKMGENRMMSESMMMPSMDPTKGRKLFAAKGCVVCHSINGIGGEDASPLDASTMPKVMNPFNFAAKMWRGAGTMITLQEDELGEQIEFSGDELADIIAFVHSSEEQKKFSEADIPDRITALMSHMSDEDEEHENKEHDEKSSTE